MAPIDVVRTSRQERTQVQKLVSAGRDCGGGNGAQTASCGGQRGLEMERPTEPGRPFRDFRASRLTSTRAISSRAGRNGRYRIARNNILANESLEIPAGPAAAQAGAQFLRPGGIGGIQESVTRTLSAPRASLCRAASAKHVLFAVRNTYPRWTLGLQRLLPLGLSSQKESVARARCS